MTDEEKRKELELLHWQFDHICQECWGSGLVKKNIKLFVGVGTTFYDICKNCNGRGYI